MLRKKNVVHKNKLVVQQKKSGKLWKSCDVEKKERLVLQQSEHVAKQKKKNVKKEKQDAHLMIKWNILMQHKKEDVKNSYDF